MLNPFDESSNIVKKTDTPQTFDFSFLKTQFGDAYRTVFAEIAPSFIEHTYHELDLLEESLKNTT